MCVPVLSLCLCTYGFVPLGARRERPGGLNGAVEFLKKKRLKKTFTRRSLLEYEERVGESYCVCVPVLSLCLCTYGFVPLGARRERPGGLNVAVD